MSTQESINLFNQMSRDIGMLVELAGGCQGADREELKEAAARMDDAMDKLQAILWPESVEKK